MQPVHARLGLIPTEPEGGFQYGEVFLFQTQNSLLPSRDPSWSLDLGQADGPPPLLRRAVVALCPSRAQQGRGLLLHPVSTSPAFFPIKLGARRNVPPRRPAFGPPRRRGEPSRRAGETGTGRSGERSASLCPDASAPVAAAGISTTARPAFWPRRASINSTTGSTTEPGTPWAGLSAGPFIPVSWRASARPEREGKPGWGRGA